MSKARTLASTVSNGAVLADGTIDAAEIGNLTLPTGGDIVGTTATQTLTGKTINASNNTLTNVSLTTGVTGTLPVANGGTGAASFAAAGIAELNSPAFTGTPTAPTAVVGTSTTQVATTEFVLANASGGEAFSAF